MYGDPALSHVGEEFGEYEEPLVRGETHWCHVIYVNKILIIKFRAVLILAWSMSSMYALGQHSQIHRVRQSPHLLCYEGRMPSSPNYFLLCIPNECLNMVH